MSDPSSSSSGSRTHIVVLGAGVLGLTSAHVLQRRGYKVTLAARDLPEDVTSTAFASPWAGANWCSFAAQSDREQQRYDQITFETWTHLARHLPQDVIAAIPFVQNGLRDEPWFKRVTPDFRVEPHEGSGYLRASYTSYCINVPLYTQWLVGELKSPGASVVPSSPFLDDFELGDPTLPPSRAPLLVKFQRIAEATSLADVAAQFPDAGVIVNATGLGAAKLTDVQDETVYPIAGQVTVVSSPRFKHCPRCVMGLVGGSSTPSSPVRASATQASPSQPSSPSLPSTSKSACQPTRDEKAFRAPPVTYVIPRAKSGQVIVGGSYDEGRYDTSVNEELSEQMLRNAVRICPDLLLPPPEEMRNSDGSLCRTEEERMMAEKQAKRNILEDCDNAWKRLEVLSAHVGLRPARKNGIRIERQHLSSTVAVVHAYGVGPAGYQASWGVAHQVALEVKESLRESKRSATSISPVSEASATVVQYEKQEGFEAEKREEGRSGSKGHPTIEARVSDMGRHVGWTSVGQEVRA